MLAIKNARQKLSSKMNNAKHVEIEKNASQTVLHVQNTKQILQFAILY